MTRKYLSPKTRLARRLRRDLPDAEERLWWYMERLPCKYRRQHPIRPYVADFACRRHRVVIECDGAQHADNDRDLRRDASMAQAGWRVIRFWNNEVFVEVEAVLDSIYNMCHSKWSPGAQRGGKGPVSGASG